MIDIEADIRPPDPDTGGLRALVADDDANQRATLARHLEGRGFAVAEATDGFQALSIIGAQAPTVALLRWRVIDDDADHAAALARMLYPRTHIILTTSNPSTVKAGGPFIVLRHPVDMTELDHLLDGIDLGDRFGRA